jgi:DNA (cytosine-5)-methyltransferase 1
MSISKEAKRKLQSKDFNVNQNSENVFIEYLKTIPKMPKIKRPIQVATLFSGIGAVEQAFERLKIKHDIVFACDNNPFVRQSYFANYHIEPNNYFEDILNLNGSPFKDKIDLLVGGSPCQSFSSVGKRKGLEDDRGNLVFEFIRIVKETSPNIFIFENVKGLLTVDKGKTFTNVIMPRFEKLGYSLFYETLNSKDFGIPQHRERLFVIGFKDKRADYKFPEPFELKLKVKDLLLDNADEKYYLGEKGVNFVTSLKQQKMSSTQINGDIALCQRANQQFNWHGDFITDPYRPVEQKYFLSEAVKRYVLAEGTKNFKTKPKTDLEVARPLLSSMGSMHRAGVDNYYTYEERIRKLAPRECLRLMGFSDKFKIVVSDTQMYKQAGNSMVVDVIMHLIRSINMNKLK